MQVASAQSNKVFSEHHWWYFCLCKQETAVCEMNGSKHSVCSLTDVPMVLLFIASLGKNVFLCKFLLFTLICMRRQPAVILSRLVVTWRQLCCWLCFHIFMNDSDFIIRDEEREGGQLPAPPRLSLNSSAGSHGLWPSGLRYNSVTNKPGQGGSDEVWDGGMRRFGLHKHKGTTMLCNCCNLFPPKLSVEISLEKYQSCRWDYGNQRACIHILTLCGKLQDCRLMTVTFLTIFTLQIRQSTLSIWFTFKYFCNNDSSFQWVVIM